jgi:hypothetical protein
MTFVGFDLHKRYITACALDASGALIAQIRQLATTIETVLDWLDALPTPVSASTRPKLSARIEADARPSEALEIIVRAVSSLESYQ